MLLRRYPPLIAIGLWLLALSLYLASIAPTVLWGDSGLYQRLAYTLDLAELNFSKYHVPWLWLAHSFTYLPFGDVAYRINLFTCIWSPFTVILVYGTLYEQTRTRTAAVIGGLALMVSHNLWWNTSRAEIYSLLLALFALVVYLLFRQTPRGRDGLLAAVGLMLACLIHSMMWLVVPPLLLTMIFMVWRRPQARRGWLVWLVTFVAGSAIALAGVEWLFGEPATPAVGAGSPTIIERLLNYIPNWRLVPRELAFFSAYWFLQFPSPALLLGVIGIGQTLRHWPFGLFLLLLFLANLVAALNLRFADKYVFYLFCYCVGAYWAGLGMMPLLRHNSLRLFTGTWRNSIAAAVVLLPIVAYWLMPIALPAMGITSSTLGLREIPYRPAFDYFLRPWLHGYDGAREYATTVLEGLPPNAAIITDFTVAQPMMYLQTVESLRPDVEVAADLSPEEQVAYARTTAPTRPVYLALLHPYYDVQGLGEWFTIEPAQLVYRLVPK